MFFILSAYLMTKLYLHRSPDIAMRNYFLARAGRVLPLYFLVIFVSLLFVGDSAWRYQFESKSEFTLALMLISAPFELWAIPVEIQFYLCFGLFWALWNRGVFNNAKHLRVLLAILLMVCIVSTAALHLLGADIIHINLYLPVFMIGVYLAINESAVLKVLDAVLTHILQVSR